MVIQLGNNDSAVRRQGWVDRKADNEGDVASATEHADAHTGFAGASPGALMRLLAPSPRDPNAQRTRTGTGSEPQGAARDLPAPLHKPGREPVWHGRGPRSMVADPVVSRWPTAAAPAPLRSTIPERPFIERPIAAPAEPPPCTLPHRPVIEWDIPPPAVQFSPILIDIYTGAISRNPIAAQAPAQQHRGGWFKHISHSLQARTERAHHQAELRHAALAASSPLTPGVQGGPGLLQSLSQFSNGLRGLIARLQTPVHALQAAARDAAALDSATAAVHQRFAAQAGNKEAFTALLRQAFGDKFDAGKAETIRQQALAGDFSWAPKVEVVDSQALADLSGTQGAGTAQGAYVQSSDTIYISRELLHADPAQAQRLLMEEMGHGLDARINTSDAVGDEGEIFSKLMHGDKIDATQMAAMKADNDHGVVMINGQAVTVEYGFLSKLGKAITGGIKKVAGAVTKGVVNLAKSAVTVGTGLVTMDFDKVKDGLKDGVNAVKTSVKAVHNAIKDTASEIHRITKQAFQKLMQSKLFAAVLMVCRFIPVVQFAVYVIDVVRAAYMVYQGIKHKSIGAVLGGVAGLVSGAGNVAGALGASAATVNTIGSVATAASRLSMAYGAVANKDMSAAMGLLGSFGGQGSTLSTAAGYAQQGLNIREAVRNRDALGALGGTLGLAAGATSDSAARNNLSQAQQVVTGLRAAREIGRGNLDAAQSLAMNMDGAQQARREANAISAQQRTDEAAANNRSLLNANAGDAALRAAPAEQDSVVPATRVAFDDDGNLMPGVVDPNASPADQATQLMRQLQQQGLSESQAFDIAADHLQDATASSQRLLPPSAAAARWTPAELQARIDDVERRVQLDLAAQQAREDSLLGADDLLEPTGGGTTRAPVQPVLNGRADTALNAASDVAGLLQPLQELRGALGQLQAAQAEQRITQMRQTLRDAGVPNVGNDFVSAWRGDGSLVRDYAATGTQLQQHYETFLADQRYTQSHGANWRDVRIGSSGMTVPQFEARVLQVQQAAVDAAYDRGKELIATGQLPLKNGNFALTLGTYADVATRDALRQFGRQEGLPDSSASNVFAVNRRISGQGVIGYPDLRIGANTISDVSLSAKNATTEQLRRWNTIMPSDYLIVRPSQLGGSYVVPGSTVRPIKPGGKGG